MQKKYAVVTIAVGKNYYLNLAKNLLLSFLRWNNNNDIEFLLVTDNATFFKDFTTLNNVEIKNIHLEDDERSFTSKFLLFEHTNAQENLFIDCDCLIYRDLTGVFSQFKNHDFSTIGKNIDQGSFFCDVKPMLLKLKITYFPKFVGSVYYFKKNEISKSIFQMASNLKARYDELGFIRLRGKENEEPLFASAMANYHQQPIIDDGSIKADAMFFDEFNCNILQGKAKLKNNKLLNTYHTPKKSCPAIVHYNDRYTEMAVYLSEQYRLQTTLPPALANIVAQIKFNLPAQISNSIKQILRPLYHKILGPSKIKEIKRID